MPSSAPALLTPVMSMVMSMHPRSVLDVGCGLGKWGALCREYLDWWGSSDGLGTRRTRIDAVEIHEPYIGELHRVVYDRIVIGDAVEYLGSEASAPGYDLILCMDMIEHLDAACGRRFLTVAMERSNAVLLSTPISPMAQGAVFGNEHERHVSAWKPDDFDIFGHVSSWSTGGLYVVLLRHPEGNAA